MAERRLTEDEAAAVFRRAAELDESAAATRSSATGLDRVAVERAAVEVGLSPSAVQRALAELDAGRLSDRPSPFQWREGVATVERIVAVSPDEAQAELEAYLRRQTMRVARRRGPITVWELAEGMTASVVRGIDVHGRLRLKSVSGVTLCVMPVDDGTHVRVDLDFRKARNDNRVGAIFGSVLGGTAIVGGAVAALLGAEAAIAAVPIGGVVSAGAFFGSRSGYADIVDRAVRAIELALDELES